MLFSQDTIKGLFYKSNRLECSICCSLHLPFQFGLNPLPPLSLLQPQCLKNSHLLGAQKDFLTLTMHPWGGRSIWHFPFFTNFPFLSLPAFFSCLSVPFCLFIDFSILTFKTAVKCSKMSKNDGLHQTLRVHYLLQIYDHLECWRKEPVWMADGSPGPLNCWGLATQSLSLQAQAKHLKKELWGTWLAQSEEQATPDLGPWVRAPNWV